MENDSFFLNQRLVCCWWHLVAFCSTLFMRHRLHFDLKVGHNLEKYLLHFRVYKLCPDAKPLIHSVAEIQAEKESCLYPHSLQISEGLSRLYYCEH